MRPARSRWLFTTFASISAILVTVLVIYLSASDIFGHDVFKVMSVVRRDVPLGTPRGTVERYARKHFYETAWDADSRCLSAEYETVSGHRGDMGRLTAVIHVYFTFDAADRLTSIADQTFADREKLLSPAQRADLGSIRRNFPELHKQLDEMNQHFATFPTTQGGTDLR